MHHKMHVLDAHVHIRTYASSMRYSRMKFASSRSFSVSLTVVLGLVLSLVKRVMFNT